jgi:ABC-type polysaccharide/polyol phosphate export permease
MTARSTTSFSSNQRLGPLELWTEVASHLSIAWVIARRATSAKYRQSLLGAWWMAIQPLALLAVVVGVFGGMGVGVEGSYAAFALSAVIPWQFFSTVVGDGANALHSECDLIRKVRVCRLGVVVGWAGPAVMQFGVGAAAMAVAAPLVGARPHVSQLWFPVLAGLLLAPALALAMAASAIGVWIRDVQFGLPFALRLLLFASPVLYPVDRVHPSYRIAYAVANPTVGPLEGFRRAYTMGEGPDLTLLTASGATTIALIAVATEVFRRMEPEFADVI